jgi:hypothetical protein
MEQRFAFVLRIWLTESHAPNGQQIGGLRGTLQAINSTEPSHFNSLRQLNELLEIALQQSNTSSSPTD